MGGKWFDYDALSCLPGYEPVIFFCNGFPIDRTTWEGLRGAQMRRLRRVALRQAAHHCVPTLALRPSLALRRSVVTDELAHTATEIPLRHV